jgi:hypothetical protein
MTNEFANNTSSKTSIILGVIFGVIGIGIMFFHLLLGLIFIVLGVIIFLLMRFLANDTKVSCYDTGFSVTVVNKRKGTNVHNYKWQDVTETLFYEKDSRGENNTTTSYFMVKTVNGTAFNLYKIKNFDLLIRLFNQHTEHLPYILEKPKGKLQTAYSKQPRSSF